MSHRLSNSMIEFVALYRDESCRVEADGDASGRLMTDDAITGNSPEDTAISGATECIF